MIYLARLLFVVGIASIVYGAATWQITSRLVGKNMAAFEDYRQSLATNHSVSPADTSSDAERLGQLRERLALGGGPYHGKDDFIAFGATGLVFLSIGYYVLAKGRISKNG